MGFTHYWGKTLTGGWTIKRKMQGKRLSRFMSGIGVWCRENRHEPLADQHRSLCAKLRGHYEYYGVRGNYKMLEGDLRPAIGRSISAGFRKMVWGANHG